MIELSGVQLYNRLFLIKEIFRYLPKTTIIISENKNRKLHSWNNIYCEIAYQLMKCETITILHFILFKEAYLIPSDTHFSRLEFLIIFDHKTNNFTFFISFTVSFCLITLRSLLSLLNLPYLYIFFKTFVFSKSINILTKWFWRYHILLRFKKSQGLQ